MKAVYVVFSGPKSPEMESDFEHWYDTEHMPHVLRENGFVRATRYRVLDNQSDPRDELAPFTTLVIYEVDSDDPEASVRGLRAARRAGKLRGSSAGYMSLDPPPLTALFGEVRVVEPE